MRISSFDSAAAFCKSKHDALHLIFGIIVAIGLPDDRLTVRTRAFNCHL